MLIYRVGGVLVQRALAHVCPFGNVLGCRRVHGFLTENSFNNASAFSFLCVRAARWWLGFLPIFVDYYDT